MADDKAIRPRPEKRISHHLVDLPGRKSGICPNADEHVTALAGGLFAL